MATRDPRIDAHIAAAAPFARPVLTMVREVVHEVCPEVEEAVKWGRPHFDYQGMMCAMVAFKAHCTVGFWKGDLLGENDATARADLERLKRITSANELPPRARLRSLVKRAMQLNEEGLKPRWLERRQRARKPKPELPVPPELAEALTRRGNAKARKTWEAFPPSDRREYLEWIVEAKREETRARRVAQTLEWLAEGKSRHWKYS